MRNAHGLALAFVKTICYRFFMHRAFQTVAALSLLACCSVAVVPLGCIGRAVARQKPADDRPPVPEATVESLKACVERHSDELQSGYYAFGPLVRLDSEGQIFEVVTDDMSSTHELAACTRFALREMVVPKWMLSIRSMPESAREDISTPEQRSAMGSPVVVILGVTIVLADLVVEAGGITILLTIALDIVDTAAKDSADAARRRRSPKDSCTDHYEKCVTTRIFYLPGNNWNESRCERCRSICDRQGGKWPASVPGPGTGSCEYWIPGGMPF